MLYRTIQSNNKQEISHMSKENGGMRFRNLYAF